VGDIGVIRMTPKADAMLLSGTMSLITIRPDLRTYSERV
jgi:hypothetical protein